MRKRRNRWVGVTHSYGLAGKGASDSPKDDDDDAHESAHDRANDSGRNPHLEHGEPRGGGIGDQAQHQPHDTTENEGRRESDDRESRHERQGGQMARDPARRARSHR